MQSGLLIANYLGRQFRFCANSISPKIFLFQLALISGTACNNGLAAVGGQTTLLQLQLNISNSSSGTLIIKRWNMSLSFCNFNSASAIGGRFPNSRPTAKPKPLHASIFFIDGQLKIIFALPTPIHRSTYQLRLGDLNRK